MEGQALARAGPRLEEIQAALPVLEAAVRPWPSSRPRGRTSTAEDGAAAPVPGRRRRGGPPPGYLAVLGRLEEALGFLSKNCGLVAQRLADICVRTLELRGLPHRHPRLHRRPSFFSHGPSELVCSITIKDEMLFAGTGDGGIMNWKFSAKESNLGPVQSLYFHL